MNQNQTSPAVASIDRDIQNARESLNMATESRAKNATTAEERATYDQIIYGRDQAVTALVAARERIIDAERYANRSW